MRTKELPSQQTLNKWFFTTKSLGKRKTGISGHIFSFNSLFLLLRDLLRNVQTF